MLKVKIKEDITAALKGKKEVELSALRMLLSAIGGRETEKRTRIWKEKPKMPIDELTKESELTDEEILQVVSSEIKKRREAILGFEKGGRQELAGKEKKELEILKQYLPEQMGEEEIKKLVKEAIEKTGAKEQKDMGRVMAELASKVKGKADGSIVSNAVKELLSQNKK
ncbi:MAG: GatB/YqeY domain-containing protein [Candidatus Wildermuthbacteria bacterium]|nr:GatB/YqeY domain-containing protein [Candidatus Wildermuthbacteria bacterium]